MTYPFEHPEAQQLFSDLLLGLTSESDRGAVLVGTAHVDRLLEGLFQAVFPSALSKRARENLLNYPGTLSSLAAKTEIAYALRLISRNAYDSLYALRKLRNDVAHSSESFLLKGREPRYRAIYGSLGDGMTVGIHEMALEMMVRHKISVVYETIREQSIDDPEREPLFESESEVVDFIRGNTNVMAALEHQLPLWELAIGIAALCSLLIMFRDQAVEAYNGDGTFRQLLQLKRCDEAPGTAPPRQR